MNFITTTTEFILWLWTYFSVLLSVLTLSIKNFYNLITVLLWVYIRSLFCNHTHFSPTTQNITRRDTIFYAVLFIWPPTRAAPIGRKFASRLRAPKSILLVRRPKPDSYFLQILTQTSACFRCVTSPAPCHPVSSRTVMTSEWHFHPLACTRVNTCFNLTPNQPMCWAERFSA